MITVTITNDANIREDLRGRTAHVVQDAGGDDIGLRVYGEDGNYLKGQGRQIVWVAKRYVIFPQNERTPEMRLVRIKDVDGVTDPNIRGKFAHILYGAGYHVTVRIYNNDDTVMPHRSQWLLHKDLIEDCPPKDTMSKYPASKTRWDLMPWDALKEVAGVLGDAAEGGKYEAHSWKTETHRWSYYYACAMRHIIRWWTGETYDADDGRHSLAYGAARLLMLLELETLRPGDDDRLIPAVTTKKKGDNCSLDDYQGPVAPDTDNQ